MHQRSSTGYFWLKSISCIISAFICLSCIMGMRAHAKNDEMSDRQEPKTLTISGSEYLPSDISETIRRDLSNYHILEDHLRFSGTDDIPIAMITGASDVDLFLLSNMKDNISDMIAKGYLHNLSGSAPLNRFKSVLRNNVGQFVCNESGELVVFPIYLGFRCWVSRPYLLEAVEMKTPSDFISLCDFVDIWYNGYHDIYPDYEAVASSFIDGNGLYWEALRLYCEYKRGSGERFTFDTELFRKMIERCRAINMPEIEITETLDTEFALETDISTFTPKTYLLSGGYGYTPSLEHQREQNIYTESPFLMSADSTLLAYPAGRLFVLAVNVQSPRREQAIEFLEELSQVMPPMALLQLTESMSDGILNPTYELDIGYFQDALDRAIQQRDNANDTQSRMMDEQISYLESSLIQAKDSLRYLVTANETVLANAKFDRVMIGSVSNYYESNRNIMNLFTRFLAGNLSLELFIQQADNTIRLMDSENQ